MLYRHLPILLKQSAGANTDSSNRALLAQAIDGAFRFLSNGLDIVMHRFVCQQASLGTFAGGEFVGNLAKISGDPLNLFTSSIIGNQASERSLSLSNFL